MLKYVILTAIGVGMSTFVGSLLSIPIKNIPHKINDAILGFAAGIMLAATLFSLILPSLEQDNSNIFVTVIGIFIGAIFIYLIDIFLNKFSKHFNVLSSDDRDMEYYNKILLFVIAIAVHNFPEGLAVGVSFAGDNIGNALSIAFGIALQNIPEGMITILPLISAGISKKKAFIIAILTGLTEVIGTLIGFAAINATAALLPLILAFAGGTMLFIISYDMIPETHSHGHEALATFSLICGFVVMLCLDYFIG